MPVPRTRRQSSLRRRKKKSATGKGRSPPRTTKRASPTPSSPFRGYHSRLDAAEASGATTFDWNGRSYRQVTLNNGVHVWRRKE